MKGDIKKGEKHVQSILVRGRKKEFETAKPKY